MSGIKPPANSCRFFTSEFQKQNFLFGINEPWRLSTAECGRFQIAYIIYRLLWAAWWISFYLYDIITVHEKDLYYIYVTNWSYMILASSATYQFISAVYGAIKNQSLQDAESEKTPLVYRINWAVYSMATTSAVLVTLMYWTSIYTGYEITFIDASTHIVNTVYVITDLFITGIPHRILHIWLPELFGIFYIAITVIYWLATGQPVYTILDYSNNPALSAGYVLGVFLIGLPLCHMVLFCLYWIKKLIYENCGSARRDEDEGKNHVDTEQNYTV